MEDFEIALTELLDTIQCHPRSIAEECKSLQDLENYLKSEMYKKGFQVETMFNLDEARLWIFPTQEKLIKIVFPDEPPLIELLYKGEPMA